MKNWSNGDLEQWGDVKKQLNNYNHRVIEQLNI